MAITADAIRSIIASEAHVEQSALTPDATLADLDISSIDIASVVFEIEDRFGIEIEPEQILPDWTVSDFILHVQGLQTK